MTKFGVRKETGEIESMPSLDAFGKAYRLPVSSKVMPNHRGYFVVHTGDRRVTLETMQKLEDELKAKIRGEPMAGEDMPAEFEHPDIDDL